MLNIYFEEPYLVARIAMESQKNEATSLNGLLHGCLNRYVLAAKALTADTSGRVEHLVQDGIQLSIWARLVGLNDDSLDSELGRFIPYICDELQLLQQSLDGVVLVEKSPAQ